MPKNTQVSPYKNLFKKKRWNAILSYDYFPSKFIIKMGEICIEMYP